MPTFDFRCRQCGHIFEHVRRFGSKALPACPTCRCRKTQKLIAPPAIQFKGSGFYRTVAEPAPKTEAKPKATEKPAASPSPADGKTPKNTV